MHPKNGLKLTGDTHLPDILDDPSGGDVREEEARVYADGYAPPGPQETVAALRQEPTVPQPSRMERAERVAGRVGGRAPWVLMAGGLLLGCMAARLLRRR